MADLGFEGNGLIYISQSLCSYYKILWLWRKKLHNLGRIYSWYVSGGTIKILIHKHGDSISVTHTDDFIEHFPGVDFTTFHNRKSFTISFLFIMLSFFWLYLELVPRFSLKQLLLRFVLNILDNFWVFETPIFFAPF